MLAPRSPRAARGWRWCTVTYEDRDRVIAWLDSGGGDKLTTTERVILVDLAQHMNDRARQAWVGAETLARRWGLNRRTVDNIRSKLIKDGLIRRYRRGHYQVILPEVAQSDHVDATSRTREVYVSTRDGVSSRVRERTSRTREKTSRTREQISESSRTRREVRDDDSSAGESATPPGAGTPADPASSDPPAETRLPAWVREVLACEAADGWSVADAVAWCEERFARAANAGKPVPTYRRLPFIRRCIQNELLTAPKARKPAVKPPRRLKALCLTCVRDAGGEAVKPRELEVLAWETHPNVAMPSVIGHGYCGEHWPELDEEMQAAIVERMQGHPPCERCGRAFALEELMHDDVRNGARLTLRHCPRCWQVGDPWECEEPASGPDGADPTDDPPAPVPAPPAPVQAAGWPSMATGIPNPWYGSGVDHDRR